MQLGRRGSRRVLIAVIVLGFALRLSVWPRVFSSGHVYLDGPDGYYHLRRAAMTMQHWPLVPQFDPAINYPAGGMISWPPLFDGLLATLALPFRSDHALEVIGALLPAFLGALQLIALYMVVHSLRGRRAALVAVIVAAILPAVVRYTLLGNLDHDPFFSLCLLIALLGVARENAWLIAAGLTCAVLGWAGAVVGVAIVTIVFLVAGERSRALAIGVAALKLRDRETPRPRDFIFVAPWVAITFVLALLHSRFSFDAGLALAAFAGIAFDAIKPKILAIALLPILPAYIPLPTLEGFNFYLRPNALRDYQMDGICSWLRSRPPGAVIAPWSFGHWIVWIAKKPVVIGPMLSVGQSEFVDGLRFFFLEDPAASQRFAKSHGVR